jgi:hypothetical protein
VPRSHRTASTVSPSSNAAVGSLQRDGRLVTAADNYCLWHGPRTVDRIYRTRANRACVASTEYFWPISARATTNHPHLHATIAREARQDEADQQPMEGVLGRGKRRYTPDMIMAKLAVTSEVAIAIAFLVMNLMRIGQIPLVSGAIQLAVAQLTPCRKMAPWFARAIQLMFKSL